MKLSAKGRYAIKAMMNIALNDTNTPKTLLEISKHQGISLSYLEQLFALLRKNNLVAGVRGPGGGYRLSADPSEITIAQIIKAINSGTTRISDHSKQDELIWERFSDKLCKYLETVTLSSLIDDSSNTVAVDELVTEQSLITEESLVKEESDAA